MTVNRFVRLILMFGTFVLLVATGGCGKGDEGNDQEADAKPASSSSADGSDTKSKNESPGVAVEKDNDADVETSDVEMQIPEGPVSGVIAGRKFNPDKVDFNSQLTFRQGEDFFPDLAVTLFLFLKENESVAGKSWTFAGKREFGAPHVHLKYKQSAEQNYPETKVFTEGYALKLEFGQVDNKGQMPGRIFLLVHDEPGAKLAGNFTVELPDDLSQLPAERYRPWVVTHIELPDEKEHSLKVGYVGKTNEGEWESNMAGTSVQVGSGGFASSTTFKPRVTTLASSENLGVHGRHVRLSPGRYVFYVTEGDSYLVWKTVDVDGDTAVELKFQVDTADAGMLTVEANGAKDDQRVEIMPLTSEGRPLLELMDPFDRHRLSRMIEAVELKDGKAQFGTVAPGKYRVFLGDQSAEVDVESGKETVFEFTSADQASNK